MKRKLVIVMQGGGIDGLNLLVPQDQDTLYYNARPKLGIKKADQLSLADGLDLGVHPAAAGIKELYEMGVARIVQQVCYPAPNQSHFESTDIVWAAADGNGIDKDGSWTGRYLQQRYTDYPNGFPNANMASPPGLGFGFAIPKNVWHAIGAEMGIKLQGAPDLLYRIGQMVDQDKGDTPELTAHQKQVAYINNIDTQADRFGVALRDAYAAGSNSQTYPHGPISKQLADVARCIIGGSDVEIYVVSIGVFDTHGNQIWSESDNTKGLFADGIADVYGGLAAFQKDLMQAGKADEVLTMTFSEFGRRVVENAGKGTDHGTAWPLLLIGTQVHPGVSGENADLSKLDSNGDFAVWNYDYRQVLKTVMADWMGAGPIQLAAAGLLGFDSLNLIETPVSTEERDKDYTQKTSVGEPSDPDPNDGTGGGGTDPGDGNNDPGDTGGTDDPDPSPAPELVKRIEDLEAANSLQNEAIAELINRLNKLKEI